MVDTPPFSFPKYQIFPAVGLARVGDSREHSYVAADSPQIDHKPAGGYHGPEELGVDSIPLGSSFPEFTPTPETTTEPGPVFDPPNFTMRSRVKRMGCRFRIYEVDINGNVIREITSNVADIEWRVRLVNKKAAGVADWGHGQLADQVNPDLAADQLTIDTGFQSISGNNAGPVRMTGQIRGNSPSAIDVKLGDLATDFDGRLLAYGGHGVAGSWRDTLPGSDQIRNPGWYDDTSDGIVAATVRIDGEDFEALSARLVVGPPDYAHPCLAMVTLFDLAFDRSGIVPDLNLLQTSFRRDVHPVLHRAAFLEWTLFRIESALYGRMPKHGHGYTGNHDMHPGGGFLDPGIMEILPAAPEGDGLRGMYFDYLKDPNSGGPYGGQGEENSMPAIEGLTLTPLQYRHFRNLRDQDPASYTDDWPSNRNPVKLDQPDFDDIAIGNQPLALNRASMDFVVGGPFYPGVEVGAIVADPATWRTVRAAQPGSAIRVADTVDAGDLTQSLALPWQTAFNQHNYPSIDGAPSADNLWPSARPVWVPAKKGGTSDDMMWTRPLTRTDSDDEFERQQMPLNLDMIQNWSKLGFLVPATFYVESARPLPEDPNLTM